MSGGARESYTHSFFGKFNSLSGDSLGYDLEGHFSHKGSRSITVREPAGDVTVPAELFEGILGIPDNVLLPCMARSLVYGGRPRMILHPNPHVKYVLNKLEGEHQHPMIGGSFLVGAKTPEALVAGVFFEGDNCPDIWKELRNKSLPEIMAELGPAYQARP
jgi:hypothetical protein